jgi:hypothetical protein
MPCHFSIYYTSGFDQVSSWLRQQAADNPLLALKDGLHGKFFVVVAPVPELAKWQQEQLDDGRSASTSLCVIEVVPKFTLIGVNQECSDAAQSALAGFIRELLSQFPDYTIHDNDNDQVITDLVRADASVLFDA